MVVSLRVRAIAELERRRRERERATEGSARMNPFGVPEDFQEFAAECQIKSGSEFIPFRLYDYQVELGKLLDQYQRHCWFKTRQLGASETIVCKMVQKSLINPAYTGVTFSIGQKESSKLADRAANMPQFRGFAWEYQSGQRLKGLGCGDLFFYPSTENAARSLSSVTDEFFDEAGFIPKLDSLYASATPAQKMAGDKAGRYLVSTMPETGALSPWWQIFMSDCPSHIDIEAEMARVREGRGEYGDGLTWWVDTAGWCKVMVHWRSHPLYAFIPNYLAKVKAEEKLTDEKLYREYDLRLPSSSGSLFNMERVRELATGQWRSPVWGGKYLMGIDPNFGGDDYYTALVWDISRHPFSLVHQLRVNGRTNQYTETKVIEVIDKYKPVLIAIEANSGGVVLMEHLMNLRPGYRIEKVTTSRVSKQINTDRIAIAIESGDVQYPADWAFCGETIEGDRRYPPEASQFSAANREAVTGHDDTVMAFAVAWAWVEDAAKMFRTQIMPDVPEIEHSPKAIRSFWGAGNKAGF